MLLDAHGRVVRLYGDEITRAMAASDLAITKSGGLTTSECTDTTAPYDLVQDAAIAPSFSSQTQTVNYAASRATGPAVMLVTTGQSGSCIGIGSMNSATGVVRRRRGKRCGTSSRAF